MKEIKVTVFTFEDQSVGQHGGEESVSLKIPQAVWDEMDEDGQALLVKDIKKLARNIIDPDGIAQTQEEIDQEAAQWEEEAHDHDHCDFMLTYEQEREEHEGQENKKIK